MMAIGAARSGTEVIRVLLRNGRLEVGRNFLFGGSGESMAHIPFVWVN